MPKKSPKKSRLGLFLIAFLMFVGFAAVSAPAASAATLGTSTYVANSTYQGLRTSGVNVRVYNADSAASFTQHNGCYEVNYGYNALAAYMELVRTGNYLANMKAYLGPEDSELVAMGLLTRHRLLKDEVVLRSDLYDGNIGGNVINCLAPVGYQLGSLSSSGATLGTSTFVLDYNDKGERATSKTIYDTNTGVGTHYTTCLKVEYGSEALAAGLYTLKSGNYAVEEAAYLSLEDSELLFLLITARERLLGDRPARNTIWTNSYPACTT